MNVSLKKLIKIAEKRRKKKIRKTYQEISKTEFENRSWTTTNGLFKYVNYKIQLKKSMSIWNYFTVNNWKWK